MKDAIAITQEHADIVGIKIRSDDVKYAIPVYIAQGHGVWSITRAEVCVETKGAIAIAQEHADIVVIIIRSNDVKFTIPVYIAQGHGEWSTSRSEGGLSFKGAIAIAQEHADIVIVSVSSDDVEEAIAIYIPLGHGAWGISRGEGGLGRESSSNGAATRAQEHTGGAGVAIRGDDIESAIAVHITQGYGAWISCHARAEGGCSCKSAIAIAQEHAGAIATIICSDDVEPAIAVHIAQGHGDWNSSRGEVCFGTKGAIAIAQEHADVAGAICSDDVQLAVAVHIAQGHGFWTITRGVVYCGSKGAIAIAQEHAGVVRTIIRGDDVEYAISVHIAQGYGARDISRTVVYCGSKGTIAIAQEHAGGGAGGGNATRIRSNDIEFAIAVHIAQGHGLWSITRGEVCVGTKGAIAIAQKHACIV